MDAVSLRDWTSPEHQSRLCRGLIVEARKLEHGFRRTSTSARIPYTLP